MVSKLLARFRFKSGIASILTLSMVLVIALLIVVVTLVDIRRERNLSRDSLEERGLMMARTLNDVMADSIYFSDIDQLRDVAEVVRSQPDVSFVQVYALDGRLLVSGSREVDQADYPTGFIRDEFGLSTVQSRQPRLRFKEGSLEVASPIEAGSEVLGVVQFGFSAEPLKAEIREIIFQHVWQGLMLMVLGVVLAFLIARFATKPIKALAAVAEEIGAGNLNRSVPVSGVKETEVLGNAMEHMRTELQGLYSGLEQQVADRTRELSMTNKDLQSEITERSQAEQGLRQAEERLRTVVSNSPVIVFAIDHEGVFTLSEGRGLAALGRRPGQVVGRSIFEVYHNVPAILHNIRLALAGEARSLTVEVQGRTFDTRYEPVRDEEGWVSGVVGVANDITERHRADEERERLLDEVSTSRERLRTLSNRLVEVQESERRHLARELHDEIGQVLTGLKLTLEVDSRTSTDAVRAKLDKSHALVDGLMDRVRELSLDLRPAMLDDLGLMPALLWYFERYTSETNVRVDFRHNRLEGRFQQEVETEAYRMVQEALTNVARHANVTEATVRLWRNGERLDVQVEDQGIGFDSEVTLATNTSTGLVGMRERAELLGGQLTVDSSPGAGTILTANLPLGNLVRQNNKDGWA